MKRAAFLLVLALAAPGHAQAQTDLSGNWSFQVTFPPGSMLDAGAGTLELRSTQCSGDARCAFQGAARIAGMTWTIDSGLYQGGVVSFQASDPTLNVVYRFRGTLSADAGDIRDGSLEYNSPLGRRTGGSWTAQRSASPTTAQRNQNAVAASLLSLLSGEDVATSLEDTLDRLARFGILEPGDAEDILRKKASDPRVRAAGERLNEIIGNRPLFLLTDSESRAVITLARTALLASVLDSNGRPAFPALAANLSLMQALAVSSVDRTDPLAAHQAVTAMERYADMLQNVDTQALEHRHGVDTSEPETKS